MPTRRTVLRTVMAAGVAGGAGSLVVPSPAMAAPALLSLRRPATASSTLSPATPPAAAVDGNPGTAWTSAYRDGQWIQVDLGRTYSLTRVDLYWGAAYAMGYELQLSVDGTHWTTPYMTTNSDGPGLKTPLATGDQDAGFAARYVRVNCRVAATPSGFSLSEIQVFGLPYVAEPPGSLARGKSATASSVESPHFPASAAFDGNPATRWSSAFADNQWLQVDLGALYTVTSYKLLWEAAYAVEYTIYTSADGATWQTQFSTDSGYGGDVIGGSSGYPPSRYVRLNAVKRGTRYGFSLWEFAVYGG
ncbi:discoidin domain-containing protein [Dactylosporangium sp. NPDC049525]|uniref:discoidin domain-containing protein n=1 Tax=Dactylosporangium sp. NPDC049525 TaxID=3154730 RepID=UPI00343C129E